MKIALAQIDPVVGDLEGNAAKVRAWTERARAAGADLVVFPEQTLPGYPARDLLELPELVDRNMAALRALATPADWNRGIGLVVGFAEPHGGTGAGLYNAFALIDGGHLVATAHKLLLPNYDVFDEARYFDPGERPITATFRGRQLGLSICEDIWNDKRFWTHRRYGSDPIEELCNAGAEIILNISASPYAQGKPKLREDMLGAAARHHHRPIVYVNQVGGNDSLVFDGYSAAYGPDGAPVARAAGFREELLLVDPEAPAPGPLAPLPGDEVQLLDALVLGTRDYARKTGFRRAVLGLSGGVDSALVAVIAARALGPENVTTFALPSRYTASISNEDAAVLARDLGVEHQVVPIEPIFKAYLEALRPIFGDRPADVTEENLQARIRGALLMAYANKFDALLLNTGNKSELATGYCTLYGDMAGGLGVIGDVSKTRVYALCRHLNADRPIIPERVLARAPSAELREDQRDEDTLPPYALLDPVLQAYVVERMPRPKMIAQGFNPEVVSRFVPMLMRAEYKRRQAPPVLRVSAKAFGEGWRFPIAQGYR